MEPLASIRPSPEMAAAMTKRHGPKLISLIQSKWPGSRVKLIGVYDETTFTIIILQPSRNLFITIIMTCTKYIYHTHNQVP